MANPWAVVNRWRRSDGYLLLDFLSPEARGSIEHIIFNEVESALNRNSAYYFTNHLYIALTDHALGNILSDGWKAEVAANVCGFLERYLDELDTEQEV